MEELKTNEKSKNKKMLKNVLLIIECVIIAICIIFSIIVISQPGELAKKGTTKFLPVQTDSMTPTIPVGALVITKDVLPEGETYNLGTIVTFVVHASPSNYLDTHRIVGYRYKDETNQFKNVYYKKGEMENLADFKEKFPSYEVIAYVTRGDKFTVSYGSLDDCAFTKDGSEMDVTSFDDPLFLDNNDIVRVYSTHVNGIGSVLTWFMKPTNFFIVILIPLILLFLYNAYGVIKIIIQLKVKKVKEESTINEEEVKRRAIEEYLKQQQGVATNDATTEVGENTDSENN